MRANYVFCGALILALTVASPEGRASSTQAQPPEKIFAAICSTCHGASGLGGASWIDGAPAPKLAGQTPDRVLYAVRTGFGRSMPGFGPDQITDHELRALAMFLARNVEQVPAPAAPPGLPVVLDILDADPWYRDDGTDLFADARRVALGENQYLKVVNTGRTWHTITADEQGKDSGFIGPNQFPDSGYYVADPKKDLAPGCVAYHCHLHPYMQTEICTPGSSPRPLTRASKNPLATPPAPGVGEIWLDAQTQEEDARDPLDGAMQVIDPERWAVSAYIPNVGNNPHSAWAGQTGSGKNIVVTTSWHDNILTLIDADRKQILAEAPTGAAAAHIQVSPRDPSSWVLTSHGSVSSSVERLDMDWMESGQDPIVGSLDVPGKQVQSGPHGVWFCDDGRHFITANHLSNSVSLFDLESNSQVGWVETGGKEPLNPAVMAGERDGCKRGYAANSVSDSIAVFDINAGQGTIARRQLESLADGNGNLALSDTSSKPVRWAHYPMQSVISPPDATTHGRFIVVSNKESFNVSIAKLDEDGIPRAIYTFPAGLGAHGVAFGRKKLCDSGKPEDVCYFAYVAYSFEDYLGVYDLEKIESNQVGEPGSASETVRLEGALADLIAQDLGLDRDSLPKGAVGTVLENVPITVLCPDCRSGVHVGDVPLRLTTTGKSAYLKATLWVDDTALRRKQIADPGNHVEEQETEHRGALNQPLELDLEVGTNTGGFGVLSRPGLRPW